jgi:hypothetical protein
MASQSALPVFAHVRKLSLAAFFFLFTFAVAGASGQNPSGASAHPVTLKPKPRVWSEDDLARLLKPWDLYQVAQEKNSVLAAAAPAVQEIPSNPNDTVLRVIDSDQFFRFLRVLDTDAVKWQAQLKSVDVVTLVAGHEEQEEIERRYAFCLEALEHIRDDITKLSQEHNLKLDLLLLIDLNALARNLDGFSVNLASPLTVRGMSAARKSLGWAKEVLRIDEELAPRITEFQYHALALARVRDAALEKTQQAASGAKWPGAQGGLVP